MEGVKFTKIDDNTIMTTSQVKRIMSKDIVLDEISGLEKQLKEKKELLAEFDKPITSTPA